jgi:hypothetical protein
MNRELPKRALAAHGVEAEFFQEFARRDFRIGEHREQDVRRAGERRMRLLSKVDGGHQRLLSARREKDGRRFRPWLGLTESRFEFSQNDVGFDLLFAKDARDLAGAFAQEPRQQMLAGEVIVIEPLGFLVGQPNGATGLAGEPLEGGRLLHDA